ncbi:MAG: hypothetical protein PHX80_04250 [Candidatus Nanoarchaeia archaeon]|nr:hypothetical protein [Candidatus Nanoarchaeia archaeon]
MSAAEENKKQIDVLIQKFKERGVKVHTGMIQAIMDACLLVDGTAKKSMYRTTINTSVVYRRGNKEKGYIYHSPSVPGEPPAVDTARLVQSITHRIEYEANSATGYIGTKVPYGRYLEFGTSRMPPRPWLGPAVEKNKNRIKNLLNNAVAGKTITIEAGGE